MRAIICMAWVSGRGWVHTTPMSHFSPSLSQMPPIILEHTLLADDWHFQTSFSPLCLKASYFTFCDIHIIFNLMFHNTLFSPRSIPMYQPLKIVPVKGTTKLLSLRNVPFLEGEFWALSESHIACTLQFCEKFKIYLYLL